VDLRKPIWKLKHPCPVCGQGSALALVACPSCSWVAVQCVEEGTFFLAPKSLSAGNEGDRCPRCRARILAEFEVATEVQLHRAGLTAGEFS
jgi:ribosomal protein S27AE